MTGEEKKKSGVAKLVSGVITGLYYMLWLFWIVFPLWLMVVVVPEVTGFLRNIGQELSPITAALIEYSRLSGIICTIINIGFPLWRFFVKRHKADVFSSKRFFWWLLITNFALILWVLISVFQPIDYCSWGSGRGD